MPAKKAARSAKKAAKSTAIKPRKAAAKPVKKAAKRAARAAPRSGGGPRADKGSGAPAVRALLDSLPAWQRSVAQRIDGLVTMGVPDAVRAVKWGAAFYGKPGGGWFASTKGFSKVVKLTFFQGASLKPVPPVGEHERGRGLAVAEGDGLDDVQVTKWLKQAAKLPGWGDASAE